MKTLGIAITSESARFAQGRAREAARRAVLEQQAAEREAAERAFEPERQRQMDAERAAAVAKRASQQRS